MHAWTVGNFMVIGRPPSKCLWHILNHHLGTRICLFMCCHTGDESYTGHIKQISINVEHSRECGSLIKNKHALTTIFDNFWSEVPWPLVAVYDLFALKKQKKNVMNCEVVGSWGFTHDKMIVFIVMPVGKLSGDGDKPPMVVNFFEHHWWRLMMSAVNMNTA
jgi:hypothetical protein